MEIDLENPVRLLPVQIDLIIVFFSIELGFSPWWSR
jgi:hypothetical protein